MPLFKSFEELKCWKAASQLRKHLSQITKEFPKDEKYLLVDQIKRASRSVTNNIAEGFGRYHYQEFIKFCRDARGSLYELTDHIIISHDEGYITDIQFSELRTELETCKAILNGFINYLKKQKLASAGGKVEEAFPEYSNQLINE